jgi:hypothetical protein
MKRKYHSPIASDDDDDNSDEKEEEEVEKNLKITAEKNIKL